MSDNFNQVKNDILEDIRTLPHISGDAWADIILRHSKYCVTDEDQLSFWNFLLNPCNNRDFVKPKYTTSDKTIESELAPKSDGNVQHNYVINGGTMFVQTKTQDDDEKHSCE
jgi:hypothetical protein